MQLDKAKFGIVCRFSVLSSVGGLQRCGGEHIAPAELGDSLWLFPILIFHVDIDADPVLFLGIHR